MSRWWFSLLVTLWEHADAKIRIVEEARPESTRLL